MRENLDNELKNKELQDLTEHLERFNTLSPIFDRAMDFSHKSDEALMSDNPEGGKKALEYVKECNRLLDLYKELHNKLEEKRYEEFYRILAEVKVNEQL